MPKQADLIAAEMQGDATIPQGVKRAVADAYERSKTDPTVIASLKAVVEDADRELEDRPVPDPSQAPATGERDSNGRRRRRFGLFRTGAGN